MENLNDIIEFEMLTNEEVEIYLLDDKVAEITFSGKELATFERYCILPSGKTGGDQGSGSDCAGFGMEQESGTVTAAKFSEHAL